MNLLIFGSEGFIGSHCVNYFESIGYVVYKCDIIEKLAHDKYYIKIDKFNPDFDSLFKGKKFDFCINAAGSGSVPFSLENPLIDFNSNVFDTFKMLDSLRRLNNECKYLMFSSAAVYGNPKSLPVSENSHLQPISPYGWHKLLAETICKEYNMLYGTKIICVRPFSVYGPGLKKQLFWDSYNKILLNNDQIEIWGTGNETRDFIYIKDLVILIHQLLTSNLNNEVFNLGTGKETTIKNVLETFIKCLDIKTKLTFNGKIKPGDPIRWQANISKINELGFKSNYSIESGLIETVQWLKNLN